MILETGAILLASAFTIALLFMLASLVCALLSYPVFNNKALLEVLIMALGGVGMVFIVIGLCIYFIEYVTN